MLITAPRLITADAGNRILAPGYVSVTGDLRIARVQYLVFGKPGPNPEVQRGLESAAGFLRNALSKSLMIRYTPTLTFQLDTSIEQGVRLTQLIDSVNRPAPGASRPDDEAAAQPDDPADPD